MKTKNDLFVYNNNGKRWKILTVTYDILAGLLKFQDGTKKLKITGLPNDFTIVAIKDYLFNCNIQLFLESQEFPIVKNEIFDELLDVTIEEVKENLEQGKLYADCIRCKSKHNSIHAMFNYDICYKCAQEIAEIVNKYNSTIKPKVLQNLDGKPDFSSLFSHIETNSIVNEICESEKFKETKQNPFYKSEE